MASYPTPSGSNLRRWEEWQAYCPIEHPAKRLKIDPKHLPEWAEEVVEFLLLTLQSDVDMTNKYSLPKRSCNLRMWEHCRSTSERMRRTHRYDDVVDLLIELALEREHDSIPQEAPG